MAEGVGRGGSDRGRPAIDWEQAFAFYASLPAKRRTYQAVADELQGECAHGPRHGREEGWKQRLG